MSATIAQDSPGLSFRLDPVNRALIATVTPEPGAPTMDSGALNAHLEALGYGKLRYLPTAASAVIASYNAGQAIELTLAECVDASCSIVISPDGLEAFLDIEPAEGGNPLTKSAVLDALAEMGIGQGLLHPAIDAAVAAGVARGELIARGQAPEHGRDGWFEPLLPEVRSRGPRVDESGHIDYRDLGDILVVHPGDPLMRRHPPTEGRHGMKLVGERISAIAGKQVMFSTSLPGTAFAPDDPDLLQAAITGQPVAIRGGMMVESVLTVPAVDTASGNIDFDGTLKIGGDVSAGMTVRASGDIEVGGVVEMATLEAGGSITIKGGVIGGVGRQNSAEHAIKCAGSFQATYAQQAHIEAGDSIFIDDMAIQCELLAINHINVGSRRRGHIVGGRIQATLSITAKVIGSPNRVRTICEIGVSPVVRQSLRELSKKREGRENQLLEVGKLLDFAHTHPGKLRPEVLDKARATAAALEMEIAVLREEEELLNSKVDLAQQARVTAQHALYEDVEIHMGHQCYQVSREHGPCAIGLGESGQLGWVD